MVETMPRMSTLNPNAPLFVPASYLATEDFSPEWWHLIQTSPAFRDYWLIERSEILEEESDDAAAAAALDDMDDFEDFLDIDFHGEEAENAGGCKQDNALLSAPENRQPAGNGPGLVVADALLSDEN